MSDVEVSETQLTLCRFRCNSSQAMEVSFSVRVQEDFTWLLFCCGQQIHPERCQVLGGVPTYLSSMAAVTDLLRLVDGIQVCIGNPDERFLPVVTSRKGVFIDSTGRMLS